MAGSISSRAPTQVPSARKHGLEALSAWAETQEGARSTWAPTSSGSRPRPCGEAQAPAPDSVAPPQLRGTAPGCVAPQAFSGAPGTDGNYSVVLPFKWSALVQDCNKLANLK